MTDRDSTTQDDIAPGADLGATGGTSGSLGGGSELAPSGGVSSDTAAATAGADTAGLGTNAGVNADEDSSYLSGMVGSTNSTGHTIGQGVGNTGSNAAPTRSEEEIETG